MSVQAPEYEEIDVRIRELITRIKLLKRFVTNEFSETVARRFLELEEELERMERKIKELESRFRLNRELLTELEK